MVGERVRQCAALCAAFTVVLGAGCVVLTGAVAPVAAQTAGAAVSCTRDDFANVVEQAGDALRGLNADNTPGFQAKLRALKQRRNWTHEQFLAEAATFVQDDAIKGFDERTATLLNSIQGLGDGGSGRQPDCALLGVLETHMRSLVDTTKAKWAHMHGKIDKALAAK